MALYRISENAKEDLRNIWDYTYDTWSEKQANKYLRELMDEFGTIVEFPEKGRNYKDVDPSFYGLKRNKHIIFYRILEIGEIEIIRILHELMDLPIRLKE